MSVRALLGTRDSNPNFDIQSVACCRYTSPQRPPEYMRGSVRSLWEHVFVRGTREEIERLLRGGVRPNEIARKLSLAGPTVDYHIARIRSEPAAAEEPELVVTPPTARTNSATREEVRALLAAGVSRAETARRLGISKSTVSYHARRLGERVDERCARRYDWAEIQRYYDAGHSMRECRARFGFSSYTWHAAVKRGLITARPAALPLDQLLVAGVYRSRRNLKLRLLAEGVKTSRCEACGLESWRGGPLSLALHHVNGDRYDNRLENLSLLCPNCHSQTGNFSARKGSGNFSAREAS
jgi:DNA-binding CsgD family transcriptional regulator